MEKTYMLGDNLLFTIDTHYWAFGVGLMLWEVDAINVTFTLDFLVFHISIGFVINRKVK